MRRVAKLANPLQAGCQVAVIGGDRAAFAQGGDHLLSMEAEDVHPSLLAHLRALIGGAKGARGIADHRDWAVLRMGMAPADLLQRVHIGGEAVHVGGEDGARARRDLALHVVGIQVQRLRVDLGEDGLAALAKYRQRRGTEVD